MASEDPHEESIKVCCRFRPENQLEREHGGRISVECPDGGTMVRVISCDMNFQFDRVFRWDANQKEVYDYAAKPIINAVLRGFNGTVFAYGQTASGKTYTMEGPDFEDKIHQGVIPRMVWSIFDGIYHADEHIEFLVKVSIVEIYNERIRDLLDPKRDNLKVHEDKARGVFIGEVTESYVGNEHEIFDAMRAGHYNRSMAVTNMNEHSSRSHLVFMLTVEQKNLHDRSVKVGKLHLVDLAGSEKVAKSGASGERLDEAKNINRSLSALGNVINALTDKNYTHVPYRDSKLTRVLQESLGGNAKTSLIITCSPSNFNEQETISTLRFGQRAKMIKNVVKVNHERSTEELKLLLQKKEIILNELSAKCSYFEHLLRQHGIPVLENTSSALAGCAGERSREDMAELMEQLQEYHEQLRSMDEKISESNRERDEKQAHLRELRHETESLKHALSDAAEEREHLECERNEKAGEVARLTSELQRLRTENEALAMNAMHPALDDSLVAPDGGTGASSSAGGRASRDVGGGSGSRLSIPWPSIAATGQSSRSLVSPRSNASAPGSGSIPASGNMRAASGSPHTDARDAELALERLREPRDDSHVKRKVSQLDKNLEQLTVMYHKLVAQNSGLKVELAEVDKKIQRKDQRTGQLERNLKEMKQKYEKLLAQCASLTSAVDSSSMSKGSKALDGTQATRHKNIIKPVKGGVPGPRPEAEGGGYPMADSSPVSDSPHRMRESTRSRPAGGSVRAPGNHVF
eukprot:CAMPEP_0176039054 /NCGR_PEP_ID=MMETSP0120_2-20121206/19358_1 /TAXON_ID=160619 /ORGANISM="Kryptoperidinium foliaceum, Strain CCMP 1326" /LENGTH=749 /DNA_ID=CAMNT_0017372449 /DNA_START=115 /DNA_END=2364 /DNA_ORIENTATION=-